MSNQNNLYVPIVTVYESRIQVYERNLNRPAIKTKNNNREPKKMNNTYTGIMTKSGKKTIERRLTAWLLAMESYNNTRIHKYKTKPHKPVFITLTLSDTQKHDDYFIKRNMLQVFLKDLNYNFGIVNYFWKAEKQKSGNIHFHILVDRFIEMGHIQEVWNRIQRKNGYTDKYQNEYGSHNPPSTHIEGQPSKGSICQYVMKYVSKHDSSQRVEGSVYRFSKSLLKIKPFSEIAMGSFADILSRYLSDNKHKIYANDFCTTYYLNKSIIIDKLPKEFKKRIENYYSEVYESIYHNQTSCADLPKKSHTVKSIAIQGKLFEESRYLG